MICDECKDRADTHGGCSEGCTEGCDCQHAAARKTPEPATGDPTDC